MLREVEQATRGAEVLRVTLHPKVFNEVQSEAAFVSGPATGTQVAARGYLWGVPVHVDPRNEENVAYVVTRGRDGRQNGKVYVIRPPPDTRRTAWSRVLDDDPLGVEEPGEPQDDCFDPRSLRLCP